MEQTQKIHNLKSDPLLQIEGFGDISEDWKQLQLGEIVNYEWAGNQDPIFLAFSSTEAESDQSQAPEDETKEEQKDEGDSSSDKKRKERKHFW